MEDDNDNEQGNPLNQIGLEDIESSVFLKKNVTQVLPKETIVLEKGSPTDALYIVLEGRVKNG